MSAQVLTIVKPVDLPSPPKQALRVIEAFTKENVDANRLASIISQDPVLVVELLRIANSAYFGFNNQVASLTRAITIIGQRALKNMVLCLAIRDALKADDLPAFPIEEFWEAAIARAACARELAKFLNQDEDSCFTAGLIQDFGLLILFYLHHNRISEWRHLAELQPDERYELERQLFDETHDKLGYQLAKAWGLPDELIISMGFHHDAAPIDNSAQTAMICDIALCADWMTSVYFAKDKRESMLQCRRLLQERFSLNEQQVYDILAQVSEKIPAAASAFGFTMKKAPDIDAIMREANLQLVEQNLTYQELTWELEQALEERDRVAKELHEELELAREVQRSLLPCDSSEYAGISGINVSVKVVSGDFYDYFPLSNGKTAFCIADVSGKGMNAALLMAKTSSLFRCLAKSIQDPSKLLSMLNHEIYETSIRGMFVTMVAGIYDRVTKKIRLANAGHLPLIQLNKNHFVKEYPASGPPLGILQDFVVETTELTLGRDCLYLYTDGLIEARLSNGQMLDREGLLSLLGKFSQKSASQRVQYIIADIRKHAKRLDDDLTLMLIDN